MKAWAWPVLFVGGLAAFVACSGESADDPEGGGGTTSGTGGGTGATGTGGGTIDFDGGSITIPDATTDGSGFQEDACAAQTEEAELTPVKMVFIYDQSGSMGDDTDESHPDYPRWQNYESRWVPVREGLLAFFANPGSPNLYASLDFFASDGGVEMVCDPAQYAPPFVSVPMRSLDETALFTTALDLTEPRGGTPTWPAVRGSLDYATELQAEDPHARVVVVLVTDGDPGINAPPVDDQTAEPTMREVCQEYGITSVPNDIPNIVTIVDEAYQQHGIQTYVIGIADPAAPAALLGLHTVAAAGGTVDATLVDTADPALTRAALQTRLEGIREEYVTCEVPIPEPPQGREFDPNKVNVAITMDGSDVELRYDQGCPSTFGWQYLYDAESPDVPTMIELCTQTCDTIQGDSGARLAVEFACVDRVQ